MITKFLIDIIIALLLTFIIFVGIGVLDIVFIYNKNSKKKIFKVIYNVVETMLVIEFIKTSTIVSALSPKTLSKLVIN